MKFDWTPSSPAFLDFETQSHAELTTVHKYAKDPSTLALTCVVKVGERLHHFGPFLGSEDKERLQAIASEHTLVAHNASFDGAIWEHTLKLPEATWYDTLPPARAAGLPGKLDLISKEVGGHGKDPSGKLLLNLCCIIKPGQRPPPADNPAYGLLMRYNERDVLELERIFHRVKDYGERENPAVMTVDHVINERGVPLNVPFLEALQEAYASNAQDSREQFDELTDGVNPKSPKQVVEWLDRMGFNVSRIDKATIREFMTDPEACFVGEGDMADALEVVKEALEIRQELVKVGAGKVDAALNAVEDDDRIRDQFVIYGAGPGRWAGRAMQLHNMPLAIKDLDVKGVEPDIRTARKMAMEASERFKYNVAAADVLNSMLRHSVRADNMLVADYNAVEARMLAFLAEDEHMLAIYNDPVGASIYLDMGHKAFGRKITKSDVREYALAKSLVLGCGYGMSGAKFAWTMKRRSKVAIEVMADAGKTPEELVRLYRDTYPKIPALWKKLGCAVLDVAGGKGDRTVGPLYFHMKGRDLHMVLPSGRPIVYRNAEVGAAAPKWQKLYGLEVQLVPTVFYDGPRGYRNFLYGSKVVENACQGACRDFLAWKLVEFEQLGLQPFLHVHDEGACLAEDSRFEEFMECMSTPPPWAKGFPMLVEGYSGPLWTKTPKGYREASYFCGRRIK